MAGPGKVEKIICSYLAPLLAAIFGIISITMGSIYIEDCPVNNMIPIYDIVAGGLYCLASILKLIQTWGDTKGKFSCTKTAILIKSMVGIIALAWLIIGSVWVFKEFEPSYVSKRYNREEFCLEIIYMFSLGSIVATYGLGLLLFCFVWCTI